MRMFGFGIGAATLMAAALAVGTVKAGEEPRQRRERHVEITHWGAPSNRGQAGYLGVRLQDVVKDDVARLKLQDENGALVKGVEDGTPAAKAGIKEGDVIVRYQGEPVRSVAQLTRLVRETPAGRSVTLEVVRGGQTQKLTATLGEGRGEAFSFAIPPVPPIPPLEPLARDHARRARDHALLLRERLLDGWGHGGQRKLGIQYQEIEGQLAAYFKLSRDEGVLVTHVEEGSPAEKAGIKAGDVIVKFAGKEIGDAEEFRDRVADAEAGKEVLVSVLREGKAVDLKVTLSGRERERRREDGEES